MHTSTVHIRADVISLLVEYARIMFIVLLNCYLIQP